MVVYEQTNPNDRFGKEMVDNLMQRGCPLLSLYDYPSLAAQRARYLQRGWDRCSVADMKEIYGKYLDQKDLERIHRLELLDEFEEWNLIQSHYFVLLATRVPGAANTGNGDGAGDSTDGWVHAVASMPPHGEAGPPPA
mmetsp:Transcript_93869/g.285093  ORF Transcript_93869/g.285093 Transcript_93869/m.285093 type:complete len:138 (+) Transcript_93869:3-416(+)